MNVDAISESLRGYAQRGLFSAFSENSVRGKREFRFRWHLNHEFVLEVDEKRKTITARDLLPNVDYPSDLDRAVRQFVKDRASPDLPEHRRVDAKQAEAKCQNRQSVMSIVLTVKQGDGLKTFLTLLNDLFAYLQMYQVVYLQDVFGLPEE